MRRAAAIVLGTMTGTALLVGAGGIVGLAGIRNPG